jgi:hypothetical protein
MNEYRTNPHVQIHTCIVKHDRWLYRQQIGTTTTKIVGKYELE